MWWRTTVVLGFVLTASASVSPQPATTLLEHAFDFQSAGEGIAVVRAGCERCDWRIEGREAALLVIEIDGRYSQHLMLARGQAAAAYPIALGRLSAGRHQLRVSLDADGSARGIGRTTVSSVEVTPAGANTSDQVAVSMAPILHARPDTVGRFTDVPLLMWYEVVPTGRGRQIRYSVIFSNEDGGTPTDRLMATWGRTTDIEFVYAVELDASDHIIAAEYQGPEHKILAFAGQREAQHPLLWVATENNMVKDAGDVKLRYAPAPVSVDLTMKSREVVMDANPWTYRVMVDEVAREGKIVDNPSPGSGTIPDVRRFVFIEACSDLENAALSFGIRVREDDRVQWYDSDRGLPDFRIVRTGCFRAGVSLAAASNRRPDAVRFRAFSKPRKPDDPRMPVGRVRLTRVNELFSLADDYAPAPSMFSWTGARDLTPDGSEFVLEIHK